MPDDVNNAVSPESASRDALPSRRDLVRHGMKLAFVAPALSTFFASDAYASYSCYPLGHTCDPVASNPWEICCPGLTCPSAGSTCQ